MPVVHRDSLGLLRMSQEEKRELLNQVMSVRHGSFYRRRKNTTARIQRNSFFSQVSRLSKHTTSTQLIDDSTTWKIIKMLMPTRKFQCMISKHAIID